MSKISNSILMSFQVKDNASMLLSNNEVAYLVEKLEKLSAQAHRLDEASCNYGLTPRQETRRDNIGKQVDKLMTENGLIPAKENHDPRGYPFGFMTPKTASYNSFGGEEYGWRF